MDSVLLQDWVTLSIGSGVSPAVITQGADRWLEVPTVGDAVFYLDVKQGQGAGTTINYQTAPRREDASFVTMFAALVGGTTTTRADSVLAAYASVPMAKYVRWQLLFTTAASITFRLWMATYSLG